MNCISINHQSQLKFLLLVFNVYYKFGQHGYLQGIKVKQSRYRPGGAQRVPDFMTTAQDGGKVVSLTHQLPLPPGNAPGTHFF